MLLMSFVAVMTVVIAVLLSLFFANRAAAGRAAAVGSVEAAVLQIRKKALDADQALVDAIFAGAPVEDAIAQLQRDRARLLAKPTDTPWAWTAEDLEDYRAAELQRLGEAIKRGLLFPAVASILAVLLLGLGSLGALYHWASTPGAEPRPAPDQSSPLPPAVAPPPPSPPATP